MNRWILYAVISLIIAPACLAWADSEGLGDNPYASDNVFRLEVHADQVLDYNKHVFGVVMNRHIKAQNKVMYKAFLQDFNFNGLEILVDHDLHELGVGNYTDWQALKELALRGAKITVRLVGVGSGNDGNGPYSEPSSHAVHQQHIEDIVTFYVQNGIATRFSILNEPDINPDVFPYILQNWDGTMQAYLRTVGTMYNAIEAVSARLGVPLEKVALETSTYTGGELEDELTGRPVSIAYSFIDEANIKQWHFDRWAFHNYDGREVSPTMEPGAGIDIFMDGVRSLYTVNPDITFAVNEEHLGITPTEDQSDCRGAARRFIKWARLRDRGAISSIKHFAVFTEKLNGHFTQPFGPGYATSSDYNLYQTTFGIRKPSTSVLRDFLTAYPYSRRIHSELTTMDLSIIPKHVKAVALADERRRCAIVGYYAADHDDPITIEMMIDGLTVPVGTVKRVFFIDGINREYGDWTLDDDVTLRRMYRTNGSTDPSEIHDLNEALILGINKGDEYASHRFFERTVPYNSFYTKSVDITPGVYQFCVEDRPVRPKTIKP